MRNLLVKLSVAMTCSLFATFTYGAETTSSIKINDIDAEVSDIKFRAGSGAKSKYSSSLSFFYLGGSLEKPGGDLRPNVGKSLNPQPVSASGDLGVRYRINKNESLAISSGFYRARPLHDREGEQLEINTPTLRYNDTFAVEDVQLSSSFNLYISTTDYERAIGQMARFGYSLSTMNALGQSRFSAGVSLITYVTAFDKNEERFQERQNDYGLGLTPSFQYNHSEKMNVYTSLNLLSYQHKRSHAQFKMDRSPITQSLGMGVAVIRDFYISPYIAFEPENMRSDNASVNLTAMINL